MIKHLTCSAAMTALVILVAGCETAPITQSGRANLGDDAEASLRRFERSDRSLPRVLDRSMGYVIFPSVGKGGFIAGGAYGKGVVYQHGTVIGYADMTEATLGWQIGGEDFAELIVFQDNDALNQFKDQGGYGLSVEASAVAIKPGAAAQAEFKRGVAVFTLINGGVMGEIAVAGQKFRYTSLEEVDTDRRDVERRSDSARPYSPNVSVGASTSTPDRDQGVSGQTNMSASGSVSTPSGDRSASPQRSTTAPTTNRTPGTFDSQRDLNNK